MTLTVFDVTSAPGIATGWAWEMISVRPPSPSSMPSVVMNDETPMISVKTPLMIPTTAQHSEREDQARDERQPGLVELVEHERREQVDRPDREVDLARDHQQHLARREDRERREVGQQRYRSSPA